MRHYLLLLSLLLVAGCGASDATPICNAAAEAAVVVTLTDAPKLERHIRHDIEVVVDRLTVRPEQRSRIEVGPDGVARSFDQRLVEIRRATSRR